MRRCAQRHQFIGEAFCGVVICNLQLSEVCGKPWSSSGCCILGGLTSGSRCVVLFLGYGIGNLVEQNKQIEKWSASSTLEHVVFHGVLKVTRRSLPVPSGMINDRANELTLI